MNNKKSLLKNEATFRPSTVAKYDEHNDIKKQIYSSLFKKKSNPIFNNFPKNNFLLDNIRKNNNILSDRVLSAVRGSRSKEQNYIINEKLIKPLSTNDNIVKKETSKEKRKPENLNLTERYFKLESKKSFINLLPNLVSKTILSIENEKPFNGWNINDFKIDKLIGIFFWIEIYSNNFIRTRFICFSEISPTQKK